MTRKEKIQQLKLKLKENNETISDIDDTIENCHERCVIINETARDLERENKKIMSRLKRFKSEGE